MKIIPPSISKAFSLRTNLRHLVRRPGSRLSPIDGLRALAVLWIILMHCIWYQAPFLGTEVAARKLEEAPAAILGGPYGVDVFFVISGFLIGMILMREHEKRDGIRVGRFYYRRFLKLMPAYFAALAIYVALGLPNPHTVWTNVIYINNFIPAEQQAMEWSWSLAIEEQFYFTFPCFLLLVFFRTRRKWLVLGGLFGLSLAIRALLLVRYEIAAPILPLDPSTFFTWFEEIYIKPYTRFGCLLAGVAAAYAFVSYDIGRFFKVFRKTAAAALILSAAAITLVTAAPVHSAEAHWDAASSLIFLTVYRNLLGVATAYIILYSLHPCTALGKALAGFLSWRPWYTVAQLAYSAYLLHPMIMIVVYAAVAPFGLLDAPMVLFYVTLPLLCLLAAAVLYVFIERPITNLRDVSWTSAWKSAAAPRAAKRVQPAAASAAQSGKRDWRLSKT
ncbi:MAG TPA: acyltransferase [Acidobacteriota bacterium]|nr:acyltransferase [Acidobacteriota bacterium]